MAKVKDVINPSAGDEPVCDHVDIGPSSIFGHEAKIWLGLHCSDCDADFAVEGNFFNRD